MKELLSLKDEHESACIAVAALNHALTTATRFDRPGLLAALKDAVYAREQLGMKIMDAMQAELNSLERMMEAA